MPVAESGVSRAWEQLPGTPVAPGGGRAHDGKLLRAGLTSVELERWELLVEERLGLYFPLSRVHLLQNGLAIRKRALGFASLAEYCRYLDGDPSEWMDLAAELTVGETSFFRQAAMYQALEADILPEIVDLRTRSGTPRLRLWSAGCSTGDEAYSLAICALESLNAPWLWDLSVTGTDLNPAAIETARTGRYHPSRTRTISERRLNAYFEETPEPLTMSVTARLQRHTTFRVHNLVGTSWPVTEYDVILCQNVLLYLAPALRLPLLERFYTSLSAGGYLIVGPAELPETALPGGARPIKHGGILVYRRS